LVFNLKSIGKALVVLTFVSTLTGCNPFVDKTKSSNINTEKNLDERPEILDISASVIWDGNETLGGNWISIPDINSPERVLIKNISNGKSVVGAVFQQTKTLKKNSATISSDAALAIGVTAKNETKVKIVAVRATEKPTDSKKSTVTSAENTKINEITVTKPFIQIGIFGVENNAIKTRDQMSQLGLPINIFNFKIKGKTYWRVVAGPASTSEKKANMLNTIKSAGFTDAYFVSN